MQELEGQGVLIEALAEELVSTSLTNLDPFDLLLHVAYNMPALTRVAQLRRLCADLRQRLFASQSTQAHLAEALVQEVA